MAVYLHEPTSENAVHPYKFGLNFAIGLFAFQVNPIFGALYYGVDGFYNGGWKKYGEDYDELQRANQAIVPGFITAPYGALKQ